MRCRDGWLNASLKSTETRDELQLPEILCQDACQRLMLHPYITASRTFVNIILFLIEFRHWTLRGLLSALGKTWVCGQSYASLSHTPTKCA